MWCLPASATNLFSLRKLHSSKENVVLESISQLTNFPESFVFIFLFVFVQRTALYVFLCWLICPSKQSHYSVVWWRNIFSRKTLHFSRKNIAFLEEGNDKYSGQLRFGTTCVVWDWHLCVGGTYTYIVKYDSWIAPNPFPKHWRANRSKTQIQALKKQKRFPGFCLIHDTLTLNVFFSHFSFLLRNHDL